jgi:hypothetical protein
VKWAAFAPKIHFRIQSARLSYYIEGENSENLTGKLSRNRRKSPLLTNGAEKTKNAMGKIVVLGGESRN